MMMETAKDTQQQHMADNIRSKIIFKNKMGSTILDSFNKLAYDKDNERIDAAITLLRHLSKGESVRIRITIFFQICILVYST